MNIISFCVLLKCPSQLNYVQHSLCALLLNSFALKTSLLTYKQQGSRITKEERTQMYEVKTDSESIALRVAASHRITQYFPQDDEKSLLKTL